MIGQDRSIAFSIKGSPGYSLVEFLVAMLILALVSLSWLTIVQVQSANRESYRREAVERLAGMMDIISQKKSTAVDIAWQFDEGQLNNNADLKVVNPLFNLTDSSIGYRIRVKKASDVEKYEDLLSLGSEELSNEFDMLNQDDSKKKSPVLVGELFEKSGTLANEVYTNDEKANVGERIWRVAVVLGLK